MLNLFNVYTSRTAPLNLNAHLRGRTYHQGPRSLQNRWRKDGARPNCTLRFREKGLSMRVVLLLLREGSGIQFHESPVVLSHHRKARLTFRLEADLPCESAMSNVCREPCC